MDKTHQLSPKGRKRLPLNFKWLPVVNTELKFLNNPWRPEKPDVFDFSMKLKDVVGNMVVYYSRMVLARLLRRHKWSEEYLQNYYLELSGLATQNVMRGIWSWKPRFSLATFVCNHVTYATMTLAAAHKNEIELVTGSRTINSLAISFQDAMTIADGYIEDGNDEAASRIYEAICAETSESDLFSEE